MALTDQFQKVLSSITEMRRYSRERFGEETDNATPEAARWLAFLRAIQNATTQINTLQNNFQDIN